jgi:hypothetical protein
MTLSPCDQVAERLALGEALAELGGHAETCASCRNLVAVSSKLSATHTGVDPGLGFSARMTVGAQQLIVARRRRRVATGLAATVLAGGLGVFVVTHNPAEPPQPVAIKLPSPPPSDDTTAEAEPPAEAEDDDLAALVQLADVERNSRLSADWGEIKKPLAAYKRLLESEQVLEETP